MQLILGAYAASPATLAWDHQAEAEYLDRVAELPGVVGLEVMLTGRSDEDRRQLDVAARPEWDLVLTPLLATVLRNAQDPDFGLASPTDEGRHLAIELAAGVRDQVRRLNDAAGRPSVIAVELHSAPGRRASRSALASSLEVIGGWEWDGVALTVEHCDAYQPHTNPQKGYLSLADELDVVTRNPAFGGMTINWGRSAIEGRSTTTPIEHIRAAVAADALTGVIFSGAGAVPSAFGGPWEDAHLPPVGGFTPASGGFASASGDEDATEPTSLLGPSQIADTLAAAAGHQRFTGIKIGVRPRDMPLERRLAYLRTAVRLVSQADTQPVPNHS